MRHRWYTWGLLLPLVLSSHSSDLPIPPGVSFPEKPSQARVGTIAEEGRSDDGPEVDRGVQEPRGFVEILRVAEIVQRPLLDGPIDSLALGSPDLVLSMDGSADVLVPGEELELVLRVGNRGVGMARDVKLRMLLPPGVVVVDPEEAQRDGRRLRWPPFDLEPGKEARRQIALRVVDSVAAGFETLTFKSRVRGGSSRGEGEGVDEAAWLEVVVKATPDLGVSLDNGVAWVEAGRRLTYRIGVENLGDQTATGVTFDMTLPLGVIFRGARPDAVFHRQTRRVEWPETTLAVGKRRVRTMSLEVGEPAEKQQELRLTVAVRDDGNNGIDRPVDNVATDVDRFLGLEDDSERAHDETGIDRVRWTESTGKQAPVEAEVMADSPCWGPNLLLDPELEDFVTSRGESAWQVASGEIYQDLEVSAFSWRIAGGHQEFALRVQPWPSGKVPRRFPRLVVEFRDLSKQLILGSVRPFDGMEDTIRPSLPEARSQVFTAPVGSRWIRLRWIVDWESEELSSGFTDLVLAPLDTPTLSIADKMVAPGSSGVEEAMFEVALACNTQDTIHVDYATVDGTAQAGEDYLFSSGLLVLAAGSTHATIPVTVIGDGEPEDDTFRLELGPPRSASDPVLLDGSALGIILGLRSMTEVPSKSMSYSFPEDSHDDVH